MWSYMVGARDGEHFAYSQVKCLYLVSCLLCGSMV